MKSFLNECWPAFWRGATRPALPALLVTLVITVSGLASFVLWIWPAAIAGPGFRYLMVDEFDTHTNVTHKILSLEPGGPPAVAVVGASITNMCLEGDNALAAMIEQRSGKPLRVHNYTTDGQTPWEMAAIADQLGREFGGLFVLGLTPGILSFGIDDGRFASLANVVKWPRLGFVSSTLDQEAREAGLEVPQRTGIYGYDNANFFLVRRDHFIMNLFSGGKTYGDVQTRYSIDEIDFADLWSKDIDSLPEQIKHYQLNAERNLAVLGRLVSKLEAHGAAAMVLESPINPRWRDDPEAGRFFQRYREDIRRFAAQHGLPYVPITELAKLREPEFIDYEGHLGDPEARRRCSQEFAEVVAEALIP